MLRAGEEHESGLSAFPWEQQCLPWQQLPWGCAWARRGCLPQPHWGLCCRAGGSKGSSPARLFGSWAPPCSGRVSGRAECWAHKPITRFILHSEYYPAEVFQVLSTGIIHGVPLVKMPSHYQVEILPLGLSPSPLARSGGGNCPLCALAVLFLCINMNVKSANCVFSFSPPWPLSHILRMT